MRYPIVKSFRISYLYSLPCTMNLAAHKILLGNFHLLDLKWILQFSIFWVGFYRQMELSHFTNNFRVLPKHLNKQFFEWLWTGLFEWFDIHLSTHNKQRTFFLKTFGSCRSSKKIAMGLHHLSLKIRRQKKRNTPSSLLHNCWLGMLLH